MKEINKFQEFKADIPLDIQISVLEEAMQIQQDYIKDLEEQLTLKDVSKSFASGVKVQIVDCFKGHEFSIGEIVEIIEYFENDLWLANGFDNHKWYINEEEANVC